MDEKLLIQDIVNLLCEKQGISKKDAEIGMKSIFELIESALASDKYVKVKGLGTFKLTEVESRESVHVNTGERIEIQGHTKVSFTPDTSLKELINKPFSHFEPVVLNEGVDLEAMTAQEEPAAPEETTVPEETAVPEITVIPEETVAEEQKIEIDSHIDENEENKTPTVEEPITEKFVPEEPARKEKDSSSRILQGIIVFLILIILFGFYWLFIRSDESSSVPVTPPAPQVEQQITPTPVVEEAKEDTLTVKEDTLTASETEVQQVQNVQKQPVALLSDTLEYDIVGTQTIHTLQDGETLIKLAVRFYGSKKFWPYILKHNQAIIKDADRVPIGTELQIPKLKVKK